jgi:hypothetical protein
VSTESSLASHHLEPLSREIHATALASLYESYAATLAAIQFGIEHWPEQDVRRQEKQQKLTRLRGAIVYHKACYDLCPSCDERDPLAPTPRESVA